MARVLVPEQGEVIAIMGGFSVVWLPNDPGDTQPWAVTNRLRQIVRRFRTRSSARRAAKRLAADEQRLDDGSLVRTRSN